MCGRQGMTARYENAVEVKNKTYLYKYIIIMEYDAWKCDNMWFFLRSLFSLSLARARSDRRRFFVNLL